MNLPRRCRGFPLERLRGTVVIHGTRGRTTVRLPLGIPLSSLWISMVFHGLNLNAEKPAEAGYWDLRFKDGVIRIRD